MGSKRGDSDEELFKRCTHHQIMGLTTENHRLKDVRLRFSLKRSKIGNLRTQARKLGGVRKGGKDQEVGRYLLGAEVKFSWGQKKTVARG